MGLGGLYALQGRFAEAEPLLKRALAIQEKAVGPNHPLVAGTLAALARGYEAQGRTEEALGASRRSVGIRVGRIERSVGEADVGGRGARDHMTSGAGEQKSGRGSFLTLLSLLAAQASGPSRPGSEIVEEAFNAAQYAAGAETARALAAMTQRFAAGSAAVAELVRQRQDLQGRWQALDGLLIKAFSQPPHMRNAESEAALRKEIAEVDEKLLATDERLHKDDFSRFAELASARPAALSDVQSVLGSQEALVLWTVGEDESYVFVLRKNRGTFFRAPLRGKEIAETVASLRGSLDAKGRPFIKLPPFDVTKAHGLYQKLLGPADDMLRDAAHLIIVADGPLQSLPPSLSCHRGFQRRDILS